MIDVIEAAQAAERILVPKGDDNKACRQAFQEATGIEVPDFPDRCYTANSEGRTFFLVKGKDIPGLVSGDNCNVDVGVTGFDSYMEFTSPGETNLRYKKIGQSMCSFTLLAPRDQAEGLSWRLEQGQSPLPTVTSFPRMLGMIAASRDLNLEVLDKVSGSTEVMPKISNALLVADVVTKGATARINGLVAIEYLLDVYPTILAKSGPEPEPDELRGYPEVDTIDATLLERYRESKDSRLTSYTIEQMRDPNKLCKKIGEEAVEAVVALRCESSERLLNELADLVLNGTIALVAKSEGEYGLGDILDVLIERNARMTAGDRSG